MPKKILVIDDDHTTLQLASHFLTTYKYEHKTLSDVTIIFDTLAETTYDLILLDIMMPQINGFEVLDKLKKDLNHKKTPVIMFSGDSDDQTIEKCYNMGAVDYICKPFGKLEFISRIKICVDQNVFMNDLVETNEHLIAATWRERHIKNDLNNANKKLEQAKSEIELQSKRIIDSINYAQRLQMSVVTSESSLRQTFSDSSILYISKDVVSGDFPWMLRKGDFTYVAAVDCTGHGVPGAMLSLVGSFVLQEILSHHNDFTSGEVLDRLHSGVVEALKQNDPHYKSTPDGMDVALIRYNHKSQELCFSGAHRSLCHFRKGGLQEIKGNKFPIGGTQYDKKRTPFTDTFIQIKKGDVVTFFSDGLPDQFGGPIGRKFGSKRVKEYFQKNNKQSMQEMKAGLKNEYFDWKGEKEKQMDDILVISIKF